MPNLGQLALAIALILALYSIAANIYGARRNATDVIVSARHAIWAMTAMVAIAAISLWVGLLTSDFSMEYVASYSSTTLPTIYKITSLWGGQQGSLLLWTLLLSTFASIVAFQNRRRNPEIAPYALAVMAIVAVFFLGMLNFVTRPFDLLAVRPAEGSDLNPLLQNYWMAIHPPSLYTGYVSTTVPFAFAARGADHRQARRNLDSHHEALGDLLMVLPHPRQHVRRAMGLRSPRMGRLLGVGSGRERGLHAMAGDDRVSTFGNDPGTQGHAEGVEPRADRAGVFPDAVRYLHHAQRRDLLGAFVHAIRAGAILFDVSDSGRAGLHRGACSIACAICEVPRNSNRTSRARPHSSSTTCCWLGSHSRFSGARFFRCSRKRCAA